MSILIIYSVIVLKSSEVIYGWYNGIGWWYFNIFVAFGLAGYIKLPFLNV